MTHKNDGGPAFPTDYGYYDGEEIWRHNFYEGMSLRDWLAGQAPPMPYHYKIDGDTKDSSEQLVKTVSAWNYLYADAMIAEREKEKT